MTLRGPYGLGIDVGTTFTAAAVAASGGAATAATGGAEVVNLGGRTDVVPSVIFVPDDGLDVIGEAAVRRAVMEPARVARWFKRRIGDTTPLVIAGRPYSAEALTAKLLRWVVDKVSAERGSAPAAVVVTHPANWGPFKLDVYAQALTLADLPEATMLPEPVAAARYYATSERLSPGDVVAVYDLGGGTFDATILRATADGFDILGEPEGIEHLGGLDFDQAVFEFVLTSVGVTPDALDLSDPATAGAVARLRQECTEAKEALSSDSDVRIPVLLQGVHQDVRLTRGELESMMTPAIETSIGSLRRAMTSAGVEPEGIEAILLVGGASRTPLVAQMLSTAYGRRIAVDVHPKHAVALGAALAAASLAGAIEPVPAAASGAVAPPAEGPGADDASVRPPDAASAPRAAGASAPRAADLRAPTPPPRNARRRGVAILAAVVLLAAAVGTYALVTRGKGDSSSSDGGSPHPTGTGSTTSTGSGSDGAALTWTRSPPRDSPGGPGAQEMNKVTAGGDPGLVAVGMRSDQAGEHGAIWTTSDGSSWDLAGPSTAFPAFQDAEIFGVASTEVGLVAAGYGGDGGDLDAAIWTSSNGTAWSPVTDQAILSGPKQQVINRVAAAGPGAVAVGYDDASAAVWLFDGTTWTRAPDQPALHKGTEQYRMRDVVERGSNLVAVGYIQSGSDQRPAVWTSTKADPATWTLLSGGDVPTGSGAPGFASVTLDGSRFVAVGATGDGAEQRAAVWTSDDGSSWAAATDIAADATGPQAMNLVLATGDRLVAVGSDGASAAVWTSTDGGATWSETVGDAELGGDGVERVMRGAGVVGTQIVAVGWSKRGDDTDATVWSAPTST